MEQFNWLNWAVMLPPKSASELMQTDTRPPSELKFVLEIDFLKKPEAIGPGLPSPFFFKADGRALVRVNKTPGINLGKETDPYD